MRTKTNFLFLLIPAFLAWKSPTADAPSFFATFAEIAQNEMRNNDIPASIKLGQAALESGWGKSELAVNGNNYFGIKCRNSNECTNTIYKMKDDDFDAEGNLIQSTFMAFNDPKESFYMHSQFLKSNMARYGKLFDLPKGDYKGWAYGLKEAGYATAPDYAEKLIEIIEKYQLYKYDEQVLNHSFQYDSKVDALNALAAIAMPSNPVKEEQISEADTHGSFGSESIANYQPNFTEPEINEITPSHYESIPSTDNDWVASPQSIVDETPQNIYDENFGSEDVTNYVPDTYKDLFEEKGATSQLEKLDNLPNKKMIGGGSQPR